MPDRPRICPSLCDWLDDEVPIEWLADFMSLIAHTPNLDWLLLTKRPENFGKQFDMLRRLSWPSERKWIDEWYSGNPPANVWIGTSVEDQTRADQRIPALLRVPARVRFLSAEPLLAAVNLELWCNAPRNHRIVGTPEFPAYSKIDWVIIGGESGPGARPCSVEWVRDVVMQCGEAAVACFVKQLGANITDRNDAGFEGESVTEWPMDTHATDLEPTVYQGAPVSVKLDHPKGGDPFEWPEDLRLREFPTITPMHA